MDIMNITKFKNKDIYPFVNELVDALYTTEINNLINTKCDTPDDKRVFMMFLIIYFYSNIHIPNESKNETTKDNLKFFLSDIIRNPDKRIQCIKLYKKFEDTIKKIE